MSTPETRTEATAALQEPELRKVLASSRPKGAGPLSATLTFGWRGMLKVKHVPEQLIDVTITPVMFTLLFIYLFGGAIAGSTGAYRDFVLPGVLVIAVLFTTVYSGIAINTDVTKGVVDRFRSLPIWPSAPLLGALLGDMVRYLVAATVIIVLGLILGFRPDNGVPGVLASVGLVVLFSFGVSWVFTSLGLVMRSPNATMNAGFMTIFPLTFLSNVYVNPDTLPAGLEAFVNANPISHLVSACRGLMDGSVEAENLIVVLGTTALLTAIFLPLTTYLYRRA
ncbi:MAG TPA: ABC transporter permease [Solirubrobacterales bacterium]